MDDIDFFLNLIWYKKINLTPCPKYGAAEANVEKIAVNDANKKLALVNFMIDPNLQLKPKNKTESSNNKFASYIHEKKI